MAARLNILLVEDCVADAALLSKELARGGVEAVVRRVETEEAFRRELELAAPDLILADYTLPQFGAMQALAALRECGSEVPLVLVTGSNSEEVAVRCLREGAADYISKASLVRLPAAIRRVMQDRRAEQDRRAAALALRRSEEQFRLITENTRDLICLLDLDFLFLYASPSFDSVLGRPVDSLMGKRCADLVHPEDMRGFREALDESLFFREGRNVEMRFHHGNGSWLSVESAINFIFDENGRPQRALIAARDTSDRKRAEKEIRKLAAFPRFNPNPVLEFAADGSLTYFNDAALEMARSLKKNHPQSMLPLNTATIVKLCLSTGQKRLHHATNIGGRIFSWSFFPVIAHQLVHCYAEDVTERMNLEAQLRQVQKMDSVGQLAAGVAHDFNNILTIIQGHAGLLNMDPALSRGLAESARQIALAAERAGNLTRQLLLFSRKQILQPQLLNLNEVVSNLFKMLRTLLGEQVILKRKTGEEIAPIYADSGMMEQLLVNLSVNARDAMPRGGTLTLATAFVEIDAAYVQRHAEAREGNFVCLTVSDTGHGMDAKTLSRIFEPFFTTKEIGKGTGLGLATVYGIVSQHQGWIEVESQVGHGTTFKVYLPQATKAALRLASTEQRDVPGGDETILLVEDEAPLRELVQEILQKKGYRVLSAATGVEALALWETQKYEIDLVLTDMMMPEGVSGRELGEQILRERPEVKVIYSSGYSLEVVGGEPQLHDGTNFLQKPYDPETLALIVRTTLNTGQSSCADRSLNL